MSIRRAPPPRPPSVGGSPPRTISESLGIEADVAPRKWPAAFVPEFREVPEVSDTVVEDVFEEMDIDVEATGLFATLVLSCRACYATFLGLVRYSQLGASTFPSQVYPAPTPRPRPK